MKLQILVLSLLFAVAAAGLLGSWKEIKDLTDPQVTDAAKFAVDQHNAESHEKLSFVSVDRGEYQVVSGTNYKLSLTVSDGGKKTNKDAVSQYEAIVYVPLPSAKKPKQLTSFKPKKH